MAPPRRFAAALAGIAFVGAALRLVHYLDRRSLWLDESMLALNVASRGFLELLRPLDYHQAAPLGFLWIERLALVVAGPTELALRAVPLLAGVAVVPLAGVVARRLAGDAAGLVAGLLCALSPILVRYSNEAKPYGTDALCSLVLAWAALSVEREPGSRRRWWILGLAGLASCLVSFPALFTGAAVALAFLVHERTRPYWPRVVACGLAWVLPVATGYLLVHRGIAGHPAQQEGYARAFLVPGALRERFALALSGTTLPIVWGDGMGVPGVPWVVPWLIAGAVGLGVVVVARRQGAWAALLLAGPVVVALLASSVRRYPVGVPRMMAFTAPLFLVALAALLARLGEALRPHARPAVLALALLTAVSPMAGARVRGVRKPWRGEEAARLVAAFRERPRMQEPVYVGSRGLPSWLFYTTNWQAPHRERLAFYARAAAGPSYDNAPARGRPVHDEGADLVFSYRGRREILGLSPGSQWSWPAWRTRVPDEGWAANEAARIVREANPCVWLYFTHVSDGTQRPIYWHLRDHHHGQRVFDLIVAGGLLTRTCFPYTQRQLEEMDTWKRELREAGESPEPEA